MVNSTFQVSAWEVESLLAPRGFMGFSRINTLYINGSRALPSIYGSGSVRRNTIYGSGGSTVGATVCGTYNHLWK
jgi:hypothetical protein